MSVNKKELAKALSTSIKELQQGIDMHCCLVASLMDSDPDERCLKQFLDNCPGRSREIRLRNAIREAIETLEESRKAFKSKKLEILRKKLTQVLIDTN